METIYKSGTVWKTRDGSKFVVVSGVGSGGQVIVWDMKLRESLTIDAKNGRFISEKVENGNDLIEPWDAQTMSNPGPYGRPHPTGLRPTEIV